MVGCNQQSGYTHEPNELTVEDRRQIRIVQQSPLGKPALMREIVGGMVTNDTPLGDCEWWVSKVINRDGVKDEKGLLPFSYRVTCLTKAGDSPELEYVWEVNNSEFGIVSFRWSFESDYRDYRD